MAWFKTMGFTFSDTASYGISIGIYCGRVSDNLVIFKIINMPNIYSSEYSKLNSYSLFLIKFI